VIDFSKEVSNCFIKLQEKGELDSVSHAIAQCESSSNIINFGKTFPDVRGTHQMLVFVMSLI
jgi:hypothetical protein